MSRDETGLVGGGSSGSDFSLLRQRRGAISLAAGSAFFVLRGKVSAAGAEDETINPDAYFDVAKRVLTNPANDSREDLSQAIRAAKMAAMQFESDGRIENAKSAWLLLTKPPVEDLLIIQEAESNYARLADQQPVSCMR